MKMETKGLSCKLPLELHDKISEEIKASGVKVSEFIEMIINEHYAKGASTMGKTRIMAFQVSEELFQKIKAYLNQYEQAYGRKLIQREFVIGLIEAALEEAEDEFGAMTAAREEEAAEDAVCGTEPPVSEEGPENEEVPDEDEEGAVDEAEANPDEMSEYAC